MKYKLACFCLGLMICGGCSSWDVLNVRSQSPDEPSQSRSRSRFVGDLAGPLGMCMRPAQIEAVGLITGLKATGSDPAPSPNRALLIDQMQARGVNNPNQVLASSDTAMVLVRGVLRPGIQKGDRFDVEVRIPSRSDTTSLRGGYLLETRLKEMAVLNNRFHEGHTWGLVDGPVMIDPNAKERDKGVLLGRGRILGGGVALKSRPLKFRLRTGKQSAANSARVANAINRRFHTFRQGVKVGVANARTDKSIDLLVHPRYKNNIARYLRVLRAVALTESASRRMERVHELRDRLLDPAMASDAALELEAIGKEGIDVLKEGLETDDPEVRFHAAEALAYLDQRAAAEPLGEAARSEPAFRVFALTALSAMDDFLAYEQLRNLLSVSSAETRYGAFRALWAMNPNDPLVLGEQLGGKFSYHVLGTTESPMIHVSRSRRAEIVLFGEDQHFLTPLAVNAGNQVMVTGRGGSEITVSKYAVGQQDQKRQVSTKVDDVIRAIVDLGGTYPDVVQALQEAKAAGALASRLEFDALPQAGRTYDRMGPEDSDGDDLVRQPGSPLPDLFRTWGGKRSKKSDQDKAASDKTDPKTAESDRKPQPWSRFFAKIGKHESE